MREHELKAWPIYFSEIASGRLPFSIRDNHGRGFQRGDTAYLREWDPETKKYTGYEMKLFITYVESAWGVQPGHVVIGFGNEAARSVLKIAPEA